MGGSGWAPTYIQAGFTGALPPCCRRGPASSSTSTPTTGRARMLRRLSCYFKQNVIAFIALFFAMAGGTAYALDGTNTVFNDDIVDDQVTTADVRDDNLGFRRAVCPGPGARLGGNLRGRQLLARERRLPRRIGRQQGDHRQLGHQRRRPAFHVAGRRRRSQHAHRRRHRRVEPQPAADHHGHLRRAGGVPDSDDSFTKVARQDPAGGELCDHRDGEHVIERPTPKTIRDTSASSATAAVSSAALPTGGDSEGQ